MDTVDKVLDKYKYLEEYMKAWIDNEAENTRRKILFKQIPGAGTYYNSFGVTSKYPSYNHWRFNHSYIPNRDILPDINPNILVADISSIFKKYLYR